MMNSNSSRSVCQRGFSLISAIFLLVVIAALGAFAVTLSTTQHQSAALDVMGTRAYQAARSGIEWAAFQVVTSASDAPCATNFAAGDLGGTLSPFVVEVTCVKAAYSEGVDTGWSYNVSSRATTGGAAGDQNYIERVISVKMVK